MNIILKIRTKKEINKVMYVDVIEIINLKNKVFNFYYDESEIMYSKKTEDGDYLTEIKLIGPYLLDENDIEIYDEWTLMSAFLPNKVSKVEFDFADNGDIGFIKDKTELIFKTDTHTFKTKSVFATENK